MIEKLLSWRRLPCKKIRSPFDLARMGRNT
jgi:hypothetical protein